MGRLPEYFDGKRIKDRQPYNMPGELLVAQSTNGSQFPDNIFYNGTDRPFEIHRMKLTLTAFDGSSPQVLLESQPETLFKRVRLRIQGVKGNQEFSKNPLLASLLPFDNTGWWDWEEPYNIVNQQGMNIGVDALAMPLVCGNTAAAGQTCNNVAIQVTTVRVEINFQGFLITIAPASETR